MAFKPFKILKGLLIKEENTNSPKQIEITPGGTSNTKTTILSSQTTDKTLTLPDATDTLVGKATTDVLTNKSIDADTNTITNIENADIKAAAGIVYSKLNLSNSIVNADINSAAAIDASKIADGSISNAEFQQLNGVTAPVVSTSDAQTLTNKTIVVANNTITTVATGNLAATELNAALAELQGDIDTRANRNLDNLTSPTAINQNLIADVHNGRSIGDSNTKFTDGWFDSSVRAPQHFIVASGSGSATATGSLNAVGTSPDGSPVGAAITNNGTNRVGVLSNSDSNADAVATQEIVIASGNKTAGTGNTGDIKLRTGVSAGGTRGKIKLEDGSLASASTGYVWTLDSTSTGEGSWKASSGGGASSLVNNGSADTASASIFVPYQDSSGTRPSDGNGGTTTGITTSITSTVPLVGSKSFLLTKDAANRQGGGWSVPFTVDPAYRAKSLKISMDYIVNSGTFVAGTPTTDSDVICYIYDVTNSQLIEPSNIKFLSSDASISDKIEATFQTSSSGSSYRLIFHIASTSASAYELKVDNVVVSPQTYVFGAPIADWSAQDETSSSTFVSGATHKRRVKQEGDSIKEYHQIAFSGAPTAGTFQLNTKYSIDISKMPNSTISNLEAIGIARFFDASTGIQYAGLVQIGSSNTQVRVTSSGGTGNWSDAIPVTIAAGDSIEIMFEYPALGKSSSVQMSDAADTRLVSVSKIPALPTGTINGGYNPVIWSSATRDTHGGYNGTTGEYTVKVAGEYDVTATLDITGTFSSGNYIGVRIGNVTSGEYVYNFWKAQGSVSGDFPVSGSGTVYAKIGDILRVDSISSGSSLSYSASLSSSHFAFTLKQGPSAIAASEKINAIYKTSSGQSLGAGIVIINFDTKEEDSHGLVTTGGSWKFTSRTSRMYKISGAIRVDSASRRIDLYKNGSFVRCLFEPSSASETESFSTSIRLNDGEYIDIRANSGSAASLFGDDRFNYICISAE